MLVYPKVHYGQQYHPWTWAPLALLTISAPLIQKGYEVEFMDMNLKGVDLESIVSASQGAVCVGISAMTGPQIHHGLAIAQAIRAKNPNLPLVWGGYHPSLLPEQTAQNEYVDIVVRGQGEVTFAEIVDNLARGESPHSLTGITFRSPENGGSEIMTNANRPYVDINEFPPLPYDKLGNLERYINRMEVNDRSLNYVSSQGCPHRCEFCAEPQIYGRRWTGLAPERVADDIQRMVTDYRVDGVMFFDSNFFVDEERARRVCEEIIRRKLRVKWAANARANNVLRMQDSTFDLLKRAGFYSFLVGGETGSAEQLKEINKDITAEDIIRCSEICAKQHIRVSYSFIFGFPGETRQQAEDSWRVIKRISQIGGEYNSQVHLFAPSPSTGLYDKSVNYGLSVPQSLAEWAQYSTLEQENKPWLTQEHARMIQQRTFYLIHGYPSAWLRKRTRRGSFKVKLYRRLAHAFSALRCKLDFYRLPVDWWLLQRIKNLSQG